MLFSYSECHQDIFITMVRRAAPEKQVLIVDTNILWYKDKTPAVHPDFDTFWGEYTKIAELELVIPEVVKGELLFQQTTSAIKALDKAHENMGIVSAITQKSWKRGTTRENIKHQVAAKFDKWLKGKKGVICETPISAIDWVEVCESAVWRENVFTPDNKMPESEKGFRDRLILETVFNISKNEKRKNVKIAFICNDYSLRENIEKRITSDERFSCYEDLENFSSYLKLTHEKLTDKFIKSIMSRAHQKFFARGDFGSLYYRENISKKILDKFDDYFNYPERSKPSSLGFLHGLGTSESWIPSVSSNWFITKPEFIKLEGEREYHWASKVKRAITFKKENIPIATGLLGASEPSVIGQDEKTLFLEFSIAWVANVRKNGTFHDVMLGDIQMTLNEFRVATTEEKEIFRLFEKSE